MSGCGSGCGCGGGAGDEGGGAKRVGGRALVAGLVALIVLGAGAVTWIAFQGRNSDGLKIVRASQPGTTEKADAPADVLASSAARDFHRFGLREAKPKAEGAIRLANYNLLNLFDEVDDPAYSGREEDIDDAKPLEEREAAAKAIRAIDADVLAVQEIESRAALEWFVGEHLEGMGYAYVESIDVGDGRGIEQAVLSRFPIVDAQVWPGEALGGIHPDEWGRGENWEAGKPIAFRRSPLRVTVRVPEQGAAGEGNEGAGGGAYELTLFVLHHKSGGPGGYWREKEAARIVQKAGEVVAADPHANVAIVGDFNCQPGEAPFEMYMEAGFVSALIAAAEASGGAVGKGGRNDPEWVTHESGRIIDHILVNSNLGAEIVDGSAFVYGTPARPEGSDWRRTPPPPGFASDHYPIVIDLIPKD